METAHSILSSPFLAVIGCLLGLAVVGLLVASIVYMLRMGVQFAIQDLLVGTLTVGFPPAIGGMLAGSRAPEDAYKIWVPTGSLAFIVLIYLIYSFYWASIRPHPNQKSRFWQRFALPMGLAVMGSLLLWFGAPRIKNINSSASGNENVNTPTAPE